MYAAADGGGGSGYSSSELALQVKPEELLAGAKKFEEAAQVGLSWLQEHSFKLKFKPMGQDGVSEHLSSGLGENVDGVLGALPAVHAAVKNLTDAADQMRATAAQYGITEDNNAADVASKAANL